VYRPPCTVYRPPSSLHHRGRHNPRDLAGDAGIMDHLNDAVHIFIGDRRFLSQARHTTGTDAHARRFQFAPQLLAAHLALGLATAHGAARTVAGGTERLGHGAFRAHQHPACRTHRTGHQHRLANVAVDTGHLGPAGAKSACGSLAVHTKLHPAAVYLMFLNLGYIVRNVVNLVNPGLDTLPGEHVLETTADQVRQHLPVTEGKIGCCTHRCQIILPLWAAQRCADQLAVRQRNAVLMHTLLKKLDVVGTYLVPEPARPAVDLHDDATGR